MKTSSYALRLVPFICCSAVCWLKSFCVLKDINKDKLKVRIGSLKEESLQTEKQIDAINREALPALVRENAQLLNMPVVRGGYDVQIAQHKLYLARQDLVCEHLMKQKASFELLQLGYELELRKQRNVNQQLNVIIQELKLNAEELEARLLMMSDTLLSADKPRTNIDSKDTSSHGYVNGLLPQTCFL